MRNSNSEEVIVLDFFENTSEEISANGINCHILAFMHKSLHVLMHAFDEASLLPKISWLRTSARAHQFWAARRTEF